MTSLAVNGASPRKKKLQTQLMQQISSPSPQSYSQGDDNPLYEMNFNKDPLRPETASPHTTSRNIDTNLLPDITNSLQPESPLLFHGATPPLYPSRKDRDVLAEKIQLLERQLKTAQQTNRELSMRRGFEEESFRQTLHTERLKLEKIITSLSSKLRDRNDLISDWISFVLNQPQFLTPSSFFQSGELLEVMKKTITVLPKLKTVLKPTMDSILEFEARQKTSRESSAPSTDNQQSDEVILLSDHLQTSSAKRGNEGMRKQNPPKPKKSALKSSTLRDLANKQELVVSDSDNDNPHNSPSRERSSRDRDTIDSDAEDLMTAIDEQVKMVSLLEKEQRQLQREVKESQQQANASNKHVMFKDPSESDFFITEPVPVVDTVEDTHSSINHTSSNQKTTKNNNKSAVPPSHHKKSTANHSISYAEKHQIQRHKRLAEEDSAKEEIQQLLYESQVMHSNVLQLANERQQLEQQQQQLHQLEEQRLQSGNLFETLFRETPEASTDRLLLLDNSEKDQPDEKKDGDDVKEEARETTAVSEEKQQTTENEENKTTTAVSATTSTPSNSNPTSNANTTLSSELEDRRTSLGPATLKLLQTARQIPTIEEMLHSLDSEDGSYDEVLQDLFHSISGLSQSIEGMDDETNHLISRVAHHGHSSNSPRNRANTKKPSNNKKDRASPVVSGRKGLARDTAMLLNTPVAHPQTLSQRGNTNNTNTTQSSKRGSSDSHEENSYNQEKKKPPLKKKGSFQTSTNTNKDNHNNSNKTTTNKKSKSRSAQEAEEEEDHLTEEELFLAKEMDHDILLQNTNLLINNIQQLVDQREQRSVGIEKGRSAVRGEEAEQRLKLGGELDSEF